MGWARRRAVWIRTAAIVAVAPVIWAISDLIVTGDPMYSLNYTTESAAQLGRRQTLDELPGVTLRYLSELVKPPVLLLAIGGIVLAWWTVARVKVLVPAVLLVWGVAMFLLISLRGFSVIGRYLAIAAVALMLFAAFAAAGFERLPPGHRLRRPWMLGAAAMVVVGVVYTLMNFSPGYIKRELALRESVRTDLRAVLDSPRVLAARRCGPIAVPNHKLIPDVRWLADAKAHGVVARTDFTPRRGVAIVVTGGTRFLKHPAYGPFDQGEDSPRIQIPPEGFLRAKVGRRFTAYVRC
jgi:hypothetical protein